MPHLSPTENKNNPCSECPFFPDCENPNKGFEECENDRKTMIFGQGCWDVTDPYSYVSCSECYHSLDNGYHMCKVVREHYKLVLKFIKKGENEDE
jgi:hypothetical protein